MGLCSRCKERPAVVFISRMEGDKTINEGLCIQCARDLGIKPVDDLMDRMGISDDDLDAMNEQLSEFMGQMEGEGFDLGGTASFPMMGLGGDEETEEIKEISHSSSSADEPTKKRKKKEKSSHDKKKSFLENYCTNLTRRAEKGEIDRIIGRDREIYRAVQILSRRTKNNPCFIGEPGVGKTAIAEGIALRIANGDVPFRLADKELYLMDLTALVAGTQFRGQFESRVKGLVDEVKSRGNVILFIDEVHNLVGTGDAEGSMNAANILKPSLSRGEIQIIGATTFAEYRKYIEKDAALERRFQPITVEEPTLADTDEMIRGIKEYYEKFHHVHVSEAIVARAVALSERYITDRYLPDKAIDLLDEACSHASIQSPVITQYEKLTKQIESIDENMEILETEDEIDYEQLSKLRAEKIVAEGQLISIEAAASSVNVTEDDLAKVIELWTGIPANKIKQSEYGRLAYLEDNLSAKIKGQPIAVQSVVHAIKRSRAGLSKRGRPASFIFVGPTGVGKTELAKVLASELFDSVEPLVRLDMSEYMERHSVSKIVGSPPGYVGYDEAGQLTERIRRRPYSIILFDEIEKAHPDVMNILLQILDEGRITDSHGRRVNFEHTVIIMTSNAGSAETSLPLGFNKSNKEQSAEKAKGALAKFLRPEFLARVDEVVVFDPLSEDTLAEITKLMLDEYVEPLEEKGIIFTYSDAVLPVIVKKASGKKSAARDLRHTIRREIEDKMAAIIIDGRDNNVSHMFVDVNGEEVTVNAW